MNILRYKWPRGRGTAKQRYELAPFHSITSSGELLEMQWHRAQHAAAD
jgi:hypothetical protein